MEPFNIFETGGREKFLKKKKDKKAKIETQNKQQSNVTMIQRNIQRFISLKRFYENVNSKIELQNQQKTRNLQSDLFYYWLLTPYRIRAQSLLCKLIEFWIDPIFDQNQVYHLHLSLVQRMVSLSISFLEDLLKLDEKEGVRVCRMIIKMYMNEDVQIKQNEARQIVKAFDIIDTKQTSNLKVQLIDGLLLSSNTSARQVGMKLLYKKDKFIEYITLKGRDLQVEQIIELVINCYPNILADKSDSGQSEKQGRLIDFESLCWVYNKVLRNLQGKTVKVVENTKILMMCLLRDMTLKMKEHTISTIVRKYKINPKIFDSEAQYREYLQQKDEYLILREQIMGEYEKSKEFIKSSFELLMSMKQQDTQQQQMSNNIKEQLTTMYQRGFEYIYQLLNMLGDVEVISLDKAIKVFVDNVNEVMIYSLGKDAVGLMTTKNLQQSQSIESKFLLLLTLIDKSTQETPDLYFTKYYQAQTDKETLKKLIKDYLLKILKHLMFLPYPTHSTSKIITITTSILQNLYNKIFRTNLLSTEIFENTSFIMKFKTYNFKTNTIDEISQFLTQFPYVFPLSMRANKFKEIIRSERQRYQFHGFSDNDSDQDYYGRNVKIRRNHEFQDAFDQLRKRDLRKSFRITFINQLGFEQKGVDAGGLKKQFLNRVLKDALNPNNGMFIENSNHELLPHPTKAQLNEGIYVDYYEFIGKLIGLAIYSNITLGYKFSGTFLNAIVGKKNCFDDLRTIDPSLYKSLIYIKDMKEDARQLELTFLYQDQARNSKLIQLLPNGHLISVTNQNKRLYISLLTGYKVNRSLEHQTRFIRKGLTQIINKECLFMFNYEELNYLISGQGKIDVDDLKYHTKVIGFDEGSATIKHFWQAVRQFDQDQKSKLLMFVTACPRPSFLGFKQLSPPFTIVCMKDKQHLLPISHTCSNVLELPDYKDKQELKKKLLTAIQSNAGFEFG